jgi:hypothetical protein
LTQASLDDAKLGNASLDYANLIKADLYRADLSNAFLGKANLTDAHLAYANLTDAKVTRTNLTRADLTSANLTLANLFYVNLAGAYLGQADLSGALFFGANLEAAVFEANSLPPLIGISQSANLELVTYRDNPVALVQLRKQFEDGGLRDDERKITYALKRRETELSWVRATSPKLPTQGGAWAMLWSLNNRLSDLASFILNKVFFDWTCQYGMRPGRALRLGVALWFLCSFLYFACIHVPDWGGLYRVYRKSIGSDPSTQQVEKRILPLRTVRARGMRRFLQFFRSEWLVFRTAMFFSLMSAFNIGFRDINFGRWLRSLTRQEFDIKAVGWVRVVAGWQSLISVYLLALSVLTYFGRPFG